MTAPQTNLYDAATFEEFWPRYLSLHSRKITRYFHAIGTTTALVAVTFGVVWGHPTVIILGLVFDYAISQFAHWYFEGNKTHPYRHLLWHIRAELRMWWGFLTRSL